MNSNLSKAWSDTMTRTIRLMGGAAVALTFCLTTSAPALAECGGQVNRWPAFSDVAPTAERIIVGTVTNPLAPHESGPVYVGLDIRVEEVLRGSAPATIEVSGLKSGLPLTGSPSCRQSAYLYARVGDVIAFAFDGRLPGVAGPVNTAAWIEGRPNRNSVPGPQLLTLEEVRHFASLPDTSTGAAGADPSDRSDPAYARLLLSLLAAAGALTIGHRLRVAGGAARGP